MNTSLCHPVAFFVQIAIICFVPFAPAALAGDSEAVLAIRSINPSPGKLATGERLNITIDYRNPDAQMPAPCISGRAHLPTERVRPATGHISRLSTYLVPLAEMGKRPGDRVRLCYWASSPVPELTLNSTGFTNGGNHYPRISFDQDKAALERLTREKGMTWPQYFDGKGWDNDYGVKFGIHGILLMWLIDRQGKVATTNARQDLAGQVEKLFAESPTAPKPAPLSP